MNGPTNLRDVPEYVKSLSTINLFYYYIHYLTDVDETQVHYPGSGQRADISGMELMQRLGLIPSVEQRIYGILEDSDIDGSDLSQIIFQVKKLFKEIR